MKKPELPFNLEDLANLSELNDDELIDMLEYLDSIRLTAEINLIRLNQGLPVMSTLVH